MNKGFTLIELIMVIVLLAIISFPVYQVLSIGILTWQRGAGQIGARQDARIALNRMESNIRQGKTLSIVSAESISFVFDYDSDADNDLFEYYRNSSDSTLREEINNLPVGGTLVVSGLSSLNFSWITGLSNILLDIQITTADSQGNSLMLQTAVLPRSVWQ
jgi:prepilin-type N-terminal cleavage/methylation domain-containing protein